MTSELTPQEIALYNTVEQMFDTSAQSARTVESITAQSLVGKPNFGVFLSGIYRPEGGGPRSDMNLTLLRVVDLEQGTFTGVFERRIAVDFNNTETRARLLPSGCYKLGAWLRYSNEETEKLAKDIQLTEWDVAYSAYYARHYARTAFPPNEKPSQS